MIVSHGWIKKTLTATQTRNTAWKQIAALGLGKVHVTANGVKKSHNCLHRKATVHMMGRWLKKRSHIDIKKSCRNELDYKVKVALWIFIIHAEMLMAQSVLSSLYVRIMSSDYNRNNRCAVHEILEHMLVFHHAILHLLFSLSVKGQRC